MASFEVVRGMLGRLFDYGPPAKMFAAAVVSVRQLPNTLALGVDWRLLCREVPELDPENPKGQWSEFFMRMSSSDLVELR